MTFPDETRRTRIAIILVILIALIALYPLSLRLISQLYVHFARDQMESKNYAAAASRLEKAVTVYGSDFDAWKDLGYVYYHMSERSSLDEARRLMIEAKEAFMTARQLNPIDAQSAYGLARVEARLEQMYGFVDSAPFDAGPYFEDAIRLRPNSILYHSALARYLHRKNDRQALLEAVENLAFVFPRAYGYLTKEKYWSSDAREAVKRGLERSIAEGNSLQDAHTIMSSLMAEENDLAAAVDHYEKFLAQPGAGGNPASELRLAELYLKQGKTEAAEEIFWRALAPSADREQALKRIAGIYRKNQLLAAFDTFYLKVSRDFLLSPHMDILHAQILAELERYDEAQSELEQLNRKEPMAEAYYELYRIAARKKDRDAMILALGKATWKKRSGKQVWPSAIRQRHPGSMPCGRTSAGSAKTTPAPLKTMRRQPPLSPQRLISMRVRQRPTKRRATADAPGNFMPEPRKLTRKTRPTGSGLTRWAPPGRSDYSQANHHEEHEDHEGKRF
jgi:tetratricopeptide (TPR) repeat protein